MILRLRGRELDLARPVLMGVVNATPDSFSDRQGPKDPDALAERGLRLVEEGAAIVDVGGESGRTDTETVAVEIEIERIAPVVERLVAGGSGSAVAAGSGSAGSGGSGSAGSGGGGSRIATTADPPLVSVDTWRGPVARAALVAGAAMINDVSGLSDESVAAACAEVGAALVITHTAAPPKTKAFPHYDDVVTSVCEFLDERMGAARSAGLVDDQIVLDPGIDLSKTPAESIELIRRLPELARLGRPLLLAVSRKDFVGALTERPPAARDAGTLAAVGAAVDGGAKIVRVHDVAAARDFLEVHEAMRNGADHDISLAPGLRREVV